MCYIVNNAVYQFLREVYYFILNLLTYAKHVSKGLRVKEHSLLTLCDIHEFLSAHTIVTMSILEHYLLPHYSLIRDHFYQNETANSQDAVGVSWIRQFCFVYTTCDLHCPSLETVLEAMLETKVISTLLMATW